MTPIRLLLASAMFALSTTPVSAGLFSRKAKPNPVERVPELLIQLRSHADESQRSNAAEELRQFDPKAYPEIIVGLIGAVTRDASPAVRAEAAASLGKIRPISQQAGYALEQAQNNDGSIRVRMAARQALFQYHLVGYRSGRPEQNAERDGAQTVSGPAGSAGPVGIVKSPQTPTKVIPTPLGPFRETAEPPLAEPVVVAKPAPTTAVARPKGAAPTQLVPTQAPKLKPVPNPDEPKWKPAQQDKSGPDLPPPS
jgi:HEAT repeats